MSRAVIYARFSCSKQREASIEDQLRVCHEWCATHHHEVVAEYADHAISGRTDERPQFQAMIANAGEAELCVVYMMDRFSRDAYDAPIYKKHLKVKGCKVVSATEAIPDGPEAILIEKLYEGLAAVESAHIGERTRRGLHGNALKCLANGVKCFGYSIVDGKYEVNPSEAAIVREVFERHNAGEASCAIARDLARRGVKTYAGNPPSYTFVSSMLKNEKYRGVYTWAEVRVADGMPRIVDEEVWHKAQTVRPKRDRANETWHNFALVGRALCGCCGRNLQGSTAHGNGGVYHYYVCPDKHIKATRAEWLESTLAEALRDLLNDGALVHEIALQAQEYAYSTRAHDARDSAAKRLSEAQKTLDNLTQAVADGMPYVMVRERVEDAQKIAEAAKHELKILNTAEDFNLEEFKAFLRLGSGLDDATLLDAMVYQALVTDNEIVATLNMDKGNREPMRLTLDRVRGIKGWLPRTQTTRTYTMIEGVVVLRISRAA